MKQPQRKCQQEPNTTDDRHKVADSIQSPQNYFHRKISLMNFIAFVTEELVMIGLEHEFIALSEISSSISAIYFIFLQHSFIKNLGRGRFLAWWLRCSIPHQSTWFSKAPDSDCSFPLMHTPQGSRRWLEWLAHPRGRLGLMASAAADI